MLPELNGEPVDGARAAVLGTNAYGHFTTMLVADGRVRGLDLHLDRLIRDCAVVHGAGLDREWVRGLLRRQAERCTGTTMLRVTVIDPAGTPARPGLPTGLAADDPRGLPGVLISSRAVTPAGPSGGLRLRVVDYVRDLPTVKHLGMFGALHQRRLAQLAGIDDPLFVDGPGPDALVTEGPTWNIGLLIGNELVWPNHRCLPGITRELLRQMPWPAEPGVVNGPGEQYRPGEPHGLGQVVRSVELAELSEVRAAFVTSAGVGVQPVASIDGRPLPGDQRVLAQLRSGYAQIPGQAP